MATHAYIRLDIPGTRWIPGTPGSPDAFREESEFYECIFDTGTWKLWYCPPELFLEIIK